MSRSVRRTLLVSVGSVLLLAPPGSARPDRTAPTRQATAAKSAQVVAQRQFLNFDVRVSSPSTLAKLLPAASLTSPSSRVRTAAVDQARAVQAGLRALRADVPSATATISELTGALEVLSAARPLTGASADDGVTIVRRFLGANRGLYGLTDSDLAALDYVGESVNRVSGLRLVNVDQLANGRKVFGSESRFVLDRTGRIVKTLGLLVPSATTRAPALASLISPQEALRATLADVGIAVDVAKMTRSGDGLDARIAVDDPAVSGTVTSSVVYFPLAPGILVPAWSQVIFGQDADWYALADARNGTTLWRKNIRDDASVHPARFRVYVQADGVTPADSPAPFSPSTATTGSGTQGTAIAPSIVDMFTAQDLTASQDGWIADCPGGGCTANETQTLGNNALACLDVTAGASNVCDNAGASLLDGNGRPTGNPDANTRDRDFLGTAPRDFQNNYLPPPQFGNPETGIAPADTSFRRASVTQQFYVTNWYHDRLYTYGFTPAARNFQNNTFGGGGAGNDRVLVDVQDGQSSNNANFNTPPDGTSGRAQMFVFTGPSIDRDGGLDSEILIHELTHGLSNRLIGNAAGLNWDPGSAMGEGWSDFYALSLLNNTNADDPDGKYAVGAYATYKLNPFVTYTDNYLYGIRRFPVTTDNSINPLTWADVDDVTNNLSGGIPASPVPFNNAGGMEVHNAGEVWANTLWEVRSRVIDDPAGANGDVPTGNNTMLSLITDALKLTPSNPSFIDGRQAIIDADCTANACANEPSIWAGFADRGLGYGARAPLGRMFGFTSSHMGIFESFDVANLDVDTVTVNDTGSGNGSGFVDPGETATLAINVKNPWRLAGKGVASATATLTSSTAGVTILNGATTYPAIAANASASSNGPTLSFTAPPAALCGSSLKFTLTITSSLGTVARDFTLRLGAPSGTQAPVTYTRDPSPDIAIPDSFGHGVGDSLTIADDYEIADLNFRVDSLTHTYEGDLTVMLRAPNSYGTDLISVIGGGSDTGPGNDLVNTLIDESAAAPNDLLVVTSASAPMTGDWLPIYNAPSWTGFGFPTDPVGQLSRLNGTSTEGIWNLRVSDQFGGDTGTLNSWSLIVTPRAFTCTGVPTAAGVAVSGRVTDSTGQPVAGANVTLADTAGVTRSTVTDASGSYLFADVPAGQIYVVSVESAGHRFAPRVVTALTALSGVDFEAE